jgi:hypothetical protein
MFFGYFEGNMQWKKAEEKLQHEGIEEINMTTNLVRKEETKDILIHRHT